MNEEINKYENLFLISITLLLIEIVFKIKGLIGFILCIVSIYFIVGLLIRILRLTNLFNDEFLDKIDILFFL